MHLRQILALCAATAALVLVPSASAVALGGTTVTVRVEGRTKTLLAPTTVQTHAGSITKGGAPKGACSATSGAGALDVATHHDWDGTYSSSFNDYFITKILGDYESGKKYFWSIFVNNVSASTGACGITLHRGDRLLFAAVPSTVTVYPLALKASHHARVGQVFTVKVVWFNAKGKREPLAGGRVHLGSLSAVTNSKGVAELTPSHAGKFMLRVKKTGYVRAAPVRVHVTA